MRSPRRTSSAAGDIQAQGNLYGSVNAGLAPGRCDPGGAPEPRLRERAAARSPAGAGDRQCRGAVREPDPGLPRRARDASAPMTTPAAPGAAGRRKPYGGTHLSDEVTYGLEQHGFPVLASRAPRRSTGSRASRSSCISPDFLIPAALPASGCTRRTGRCRTRRRARRTNSRSRRRTSRPSRRRCSQTIRRQAFERSTPEVERETTALQQKARRRAG